MKTRSDLMRRTSLKTLAFGMAIVGTTFISQAQWVAYNDHAPGSIGTQTHTNATTNNIRLGTSGPLKNIANGTNLPVTLSITRSGTGISYATLGASPLSATPLFSSFSGFVFFGSSTDSNVELTNSTVTYTFTGLNPAKRYNFRGGAVRGLSPVTQSNRWTKVDITGATSFDALHSANVI